MAYVKYAVNSKFRTCKLRSTKAANSPSYYQDNPNYGLLEIQTYEHPKIKYNKKLIFVYTKFCQGSNNDIKKTEFLLLEARMRKMSDRYERINSIFNYIII